jgi:hypothetical protein
VLEPFASERHHIDAVTWEDMHEKVGYLFDSGLKSRLENLPYLPSSFRAMGKEAGAEFEPRSAQWFYRIQCQALAGDLPTSRFRVVRDLQAQLRRRKGALTQDALGGTDAARFEVNPTLEAEYSPGGAWPRGETKRTFVDEMMAQIPGMNGPRAAPMEDTSFGPTVQDGQKATLDTSRYSRWYSLGADAMGRSQQKRAFNDNLWVAQTTHRKVSPSYACVSGNDLGQTSSDQDKARSQECRDTALAECTARRWGDASGGATGAKCVRTSDLRRCMYKKCWETRWTYAIPLEVVYTTPLNTWNPHNLPFVEGKSGTAFDEVTKDRDGSAAKPYRGTRFNRFFRTPAAFFRDREDVDSADTSGGVFSVEDAKGSVRQVRASGFFTNMPPIDGVGTVRTRYPIMPIHEEGNTVWKEAKALQDVVLGMEEDDRMKRLLKDARAMEYGLDLYIYQSSHSHAVRISATQYRQLVAGTTDVVKVKTSGNGHGHYVGVCPASAVTSIRSRRQ